MTEEFLITLFGQIGQIRGCKIIHEVISVGNRLVLMKYMSLFQLSCSRFLVVSLPWINRTSGVVLSVVFVTFPRVPYLEWQYLFEIVCETFLS